MLDRYSLRADVAQLASSFALDAQASGLIVLSSEVEHHQWSAVVRETPQQQRIISRMRWGMAPTCMSWFDEVMKKFTATSETVQGAPAFRKAFEVFRCLVPADGFHAALKQGRGGIQAGLMTLQDEQTFAFAGLWDRWVYGAEILESFAILTIESQAFAGDRMPVILSRSDYNRWLDPASPSTELLPLLKPYPLDSLLLHPDSRPLPMVKEEPGDHRLPAAA